MGYIVGGEKERPKYDSWYLFQFFLTYQTNTKQTTKGEIEENAQITANFRRRCKDVEIQVPFSFFYSLIGLDLTFVCFVLD